MTRAELVTYLEATYTNLSIEDDGEVLTVTDDDSGSVTKLTVDSDLIENTAVDDEPRVHFLIDSVSLVE